MIKLNKDAAINDYESAIKIISQVQDMHVEWRPDIYKYNNNLIPKEAFEEIVETNTFFVAENENEKIVGVLEIAFRHIETPAHVTRDIIFIDTMAVDEKYNGEWKLETGGGGQAFSDTTGRIALSFDRLDEEIKAVTVELYPPDTKAELDEEEIEDLVEILHQVVIYKKDDTYNEYCGQAVVYKITKNDGTTIEVQAYNPFLIIDGIGYTIKYEPCQQLNSLGNKINDRNH